MILISQTLRPDLLEYYLGEIFITPNLIAQSVHYAVTGRSFSGVQLAIYGTQDDTNEFWLKLFGWR